MTVQVNDQERTRVRDEWLGWVNRLVSEVEAWAQGLGWATHRDVKTIEESLLGTYTAPFLRVRLPEGEVHVNPVALNVIGADGRVDLEGWPTLNRVRLVRRRGAMEIITDSNVPLRQPWNRDTFVQLARDLTAA